MPLYHSLLRHGSSKKEKTLVLLASYCYEKGANQ